jgi:hypothetical protein
MVNFKYKTVRVVCKGKIKVCDNCKDIPISEGYCKLCRRPLWKKEGETCNSIIAYYKGDLKQGKEIVCKECKTLNYFKEHIIGVDILCKECNSITSI